MRGWWRVPAFVATVSCADVMSAQSLDRKDKPFVRAAVLVLGHDLLAARCVERFTFPADGVAKIAAWVRVNEVERIRERTRELEQQDADAKRQFDLVRRIFGSRFSAQGQAACKSAVDATQRPDAQFAEVAPDMIAALRTRVSAHATTVAVVPVVEPTASVVTTTAPPPSHSNESATRVAARIESFGFDTRPTMGIGGFIGLDVYPIVLFRDGSALTDVEGLGFPAGLDAHRRAHAAKWTHWRKVGSEIQLEKQGKWDKLAFRKTYSTLPRDFRLNGRFTRLSGVGTVAVGGSQSVTAVRQYLFTPDGRVMRDAAVGSTGSSGNASVVTSSVAPSQRGRYSIEGITLLIRYDDGREERRILVTDPTDPDVIWLDGEGYTSK